MSDSTHLIATRALLESIEDRPIEKPEEYTFTQYGYIDHDRTAHFLNIGKHKITDALAVIPYDHLTLCRALGRECPVYRPDKQVGKAPGELTVGDLVCLQTISTSLCFMDKIPLAFAMGRQNQAVLDVDISHVIAILKWIPGMEDIDASYLVTVDDGVLIDKRHLIKLMDVEKKDYPAIASEKKHTTAQMIAAAYCVLLMITKTLSPKVNDHIGVFLGKRLSALTHSLGPSAKGVTWPTTQTLFYPGQLELLQNQLSYYPMLKKAIFIPIVNRYTPVTQHMHEIFKDSAMTIFSVIHEFLTTPDVTLLHIYAPLFTQMKEWSAVMEELYKKFGKSWYFYKLMVPTGVLTSQKAFPLLGCAALSWKRAMSTATGSASITQLQGVGINKEYEKMAAKVLPPTLVGTAANRRLAGIKSMIGVNHIDIKWEEIAQAMEDGTFDPEKM